MYALQEKPFAPDPDPDFLFLSDTYETALAVLANGLANGVCVNAVLGDCGTGKTTLIEYLLHHNPPGNAVGLISDVIKSKDDLMRLALAGFGQARKASKKKDDYQRLVEFLRTSHKKQQQPALLMIDGAHTMSADALKGLSQLSELNTQNDLRLQFVLVGQKSLLKLVQHTEIKGISEKIGTLCYLEPLTAEETKRYIYHRLDVAGVAGAELFDEKACLAIHGYSKGIPKATNTLCEEALACGSAEQIGKIDAALIHKIVKDNWQPDTYPERPPVLEPRNIEIPWYKKYCMPALLVTGFFIGVILATLLVTH